MFYLDNLKASVTVLRQLSDEWKDHSVKHSCLDQVRETLKSFRQKVTYFSYLSAYLLTEMYTVLK